MVAGEVVGEYEKRDRFMSWVKSLEPRNSLDMPYIRVLPIAGQTEKAGE